MADTSTTDNTQETTDRNAVAVAFILRCAELGVLVRLAASQRTVELVGKNGITPSAMLNHQLKILKPDVLDYLRRKAAAERAARGGTSSPYDATPAGIVWRHGDSETLLCNFTALITAVVIEDDGTPDPPRQFEVTCALGGHTQTVSVAASQFASMGWVPSLLGPRAIVEPGFGVQDRLRAAIQHLSHDIVDRRTYTHTGWQNVGDVWMYLHASGAISMDGAVSGIAVRLPNALTNYRFPLPPATREAIARAVRSSLAVLAVAPETVTFPVLVQTYRAAIRPTSSSIGIVGESDAGKSCTAALGIQHYGPEMDHEHFPASWFDSDNAIPELQFTLKDAPLGIDDFNPRGTRSDRERMHGRANRVLRGQANRQGRLRMRRDTTLARKRDPRGSVIWTGEDLLQGQSLQMRAMTTKLVKGTVDWDAMTRCQQDAAAGLCAEAMAAFIQWQAGRYETLQARWRDEVTALRTQVAGPFRRTTTIVADLLWGWKVALEFMVDRAGLTPDEQHQLWERACQAFRIVAADQIELLEEAEPASRSLSLLSAAVASAKSHLTSLKTNERPAHAASHGWRHQESESEDSEGRRSMRTEWRAYGDHIGYVDAHGEIYLEPAAAYAMATRLAEAEGATLGVGLVAWKKRLHERRLLAEIEKDDTRIYLDVRKVVAGTRRRVLHIAAGAWNPEIPNPPPQQPPGDSQQSPIDSPSTLHQCGQCGQRDDSPDLTRCSGGRSGSDEDAQCGQREPLKNKSEVGNGHTGHKIPDKEESLEGSISASESSPDPPVWRGAGPFLAQAAKAGVPVTTAGGRVVVFGDREPFVTEVRRHQAELLAMLQRPPCHACKSTTWWVSSAGGVLCRQCKPPYADNLVAMTFDTTGGL
jgi:hypothetical protein